MNSEYKIIKVRESELFAEDKLTEEVNKHLNEGWELQGGQSRSDGSPSFITQAVTRTEEKKLEFEMKDYAPIRADSDDGEIKTEIDHLSDYLVVRVFQEIGKVVHNDIDFVEPIPRNSSTRKPLTKGTQSTFANISSKPPFQDIRNPANIIAGKNRARIYDLIKYLGQEWAYCCTFETNGKGTLECSLFPFNFMVRFFLNC